MRALCSTLHSCQESVRCCQESKHRQQQRGPMSTRADYLPHVCSACNGALMWRPPCLGLQLTTPHHKAT